MYSLSEPVRPVLTEREAVWEVVKDGAWRTLPEISSSLERRFGHKHLATSISARLRELRSRQYGAWIVERRVREGCDKLHEYCVRVELGAGHFTYTSAKPKPAAQKLKGNRAQMSFALERAAIFAADNLCDADD